MVSAKPPAAAADDLTEIDWFTLLFNRPCPPPTWWVGEAISRRTSHIELRAAAAACLLAPPLGLEIGNPPYLPSLPRLAKAWREAANQHHLFLPIPDGMRTAVVMLKTLNAAVDCLESGPGGRRAGEAALVPELLDARADGARLVQALRDHGIPLSAVNYRLSPAEKADLQRQVDDVHARAAAPAEPVRRQAEPRAKPAKRKPAAARAEEQPAAPAAPAPAPKTSFASWLE
jgi:hypothetical protein